MHRFNNSTISSNVDTARTLNKPTATLNINNIVKASKTNRTNTGRAFIVMSTPTRNKDSCLYPLYIAYGVSFCHILS